MEGRGYYRRENYRIGANTRKKYFLRSYLDTYSEYDRVVFCDELEKSESRLLSVRRPINF